MDHDGPALVECLVDAYEAPYGDTIKPLHADKITTAYEKGEPERGRMARNLLEPGRVELSPAVQHAESELRKYS